MKGHRHHHRTKRHEVGASHALLMELLVALVDALVEAMDDIKAGRIQGRRHTAAILEVIRKTLKDQGVRAVNTSEMQIGLAALAVSAREALQQAKQDELSADDEARAIEEVLGAPFTLPTPKKGSE